MRIFGYISVLLLLSGCFVAETPRVPYEFSGNTEACIVDGQYKSYNSNYCNYIGGTIAQDFKLLCRDPYKEIRHVVKRKDECNGYILKTLPPDAEIISTVDKIQHAVGTKPIVLENEIDEAKKEQTITSSQKRDETQTTHSQQSVSTIGESESKRERSKAEKLCWIVARSDAEQAKIALDVSTRNDTNGGFLGGFLRADSNNMKAKRIEKLSFRTCMAEKGFLTK